MKVLLVMKSGCPHCPPAIERFKKTHPDGRIIYVESAEGLALAKKYGIKSVPQELEIK